MSEILANIVVEQNNINFQPENNNLNITPNAIQLSIYTAGMGSPGAGGNAGELQFNNSGVLGGAANTLVTANGNVRFTNISNIKINGGSAGFYLQTDGSGNLTWANGTANITGNGTAAGANNAIQLSDGTGNFKVGSGFNFDPSSNILDVPGNTTSVNFIGTLANGTSNIQIATNGNITITSNGNSSAVISDQLLTVPNLIVNSENLRLGNFAGANAQDPKSIAIGYRAGQNTQGQEAIALGRDAGNNIQGVASIGIGTSAGRNIQGNGAVAIGFIAGEGAQGQEAVAIGPSAGESNQGIQSIAIGFAAGRTNQPNNSIIINASGSNLNAAQQQAFYVKPVRNANTANLLYYNNSTGEIVYDLAPSTSSISNGTSNVNIPSANGNVNISSNGNANVVVVTGTGANVNGNLTITGNLIANNFTQGLISNGTSNVSIPTANGNINFSVANIANVIQVSGNGNILNNGLTNSIGGFTTAANIIAARVTANTLMTTTTSNVTTQLNVANITITSGLSLALGNTANAGNPTTGSAVAIGYGTFANNTSGTAVGYTARARQARTTAVGFGAGGGGTPGIDNTFIGYNAGAVGNANIYDGCTFVGIYAGQRQDGEYNVALGYAAGMGVYANSTIATGQAGYAVAIGMDAGRINQKTGAIALGAFSGKFDQGVNSIAIGNNAGNSSQANNSIIINATGSILDNTTANSLVVKPIRNAANTNVLMYNSTSGEITYETLGAYTGYVKTISTTIGALTAANTAGAGSRAFVTDANLVAAGNFGAVVGSGGSNSVPIYSDGTDWRIG